MIQKDEVQSIMTSQISYRTIQKNKTLSGFIKKDNEAIMEEKEESA